MPKVPGPFDEFLSQSDVPEKTDFLALRVFDNGGDAGPYIRRTSSLPYNSKDPASVERWLNQQLGPILLKLELTPRRCIYCGTDYRNIENIGRWLCRWHSGHVDHNNCYTCCGRENGSPECQPCDHTPIANPVGARWDVDNINIDIPTGVFMLLAPNRESIECEGRNSRNPARSFYRIKRAKI